MGAGAIVAGVGLAATAAGTAYSSSKQSSAVKKAANTQASAAQNSTQLQQQMYQEQVAREQPWLTSGQNALTSLNSQLPSLTSRYSLQDYYASPEYQAQLAASNQATRNLQAQGAAKGAYGSGYLANAIAANSQQNALQGYQTGLQDYTAQNTNIYNMLNSQAQSGQQAAANLGSTGQGVANAISNLQTQAANAQAAGTIGSANAQANMAMGLGNQAMGAVGAYNQNQMYQNYLNTLNTTPSYATTPGIGTNVPSYSESTSLQSTNPAMSGLYS